MYRELEEEIGTCEVDLIGQLDRTIRYDWPEELRGESSRSRRWIGQEQTYFLVRLRPNATICLEHPSRRNFCNEMHQEGYCN
jgi:hypothetical protein